MFTMLAIFLFWPVQAGIRYHRDVRVGVERAQHLDRLQRRVSRIVHAEQILHVARIILLKEARQVIEQVPLVTV
jgi:hypothetical protein